MPKPRVIIADDHQLVVAGLQSLLGSECEVVATANDGASLLSDVRRLSPDMVLLDVSMPPYKGLDLIREVRRIDPGIGIVIVTMNDDTDVAAAAFRAGATAYVLKNSAASELVDAVHLVSERQPYVTPLVAGGIIKSLMKPVDIDTDHPLTRRQREVLRLLAEGKSMKEIAHIMDLTVRTVAFHKYRMMKQLNIKTSAELIRFAVARDIV